MDTLKSRIPAYPVNRQNEVSLGFSIYRIFMQECYKGWYLYLSDYKKGNLFTMSSLTEPYYNSLRDYYKIVGIPEMTNGYEEVIKQLKKIHLNQRSIKRK